MTAEERRIYRKKLRDAVKDYKSARRDAALHIMRGGGQWDTLQERVRWSALNVAELVASRCRP